MKNYEIKLKSGDIVVAQGDYVSNQPLSDLFYIFRGVPNSSSESSEHRVKFSSRLSDVIYCKEVL